MTEVIVNEESVIDTENKKDKKTPILKTSKETLWEKARVG